MSDDATVTVPPVARAPLRPGALLADRYLLVEALGQGGMGVVYRAHDVLVGEDVALKIMHDVDDGAGLLRELSHARKVTHKHVARIYDVGRADGRTFLTMELVDGESLRGRLDRDRRLTVAAAAGVVAQVVDGLVAAHDAGVVHCDMKPGNVLIADDGRVVVIDFGIARALRVRGDDDDRVEGTHDYMAPEQVQGHAVTPKSDVFAVGLLLFEAVQGGRPFHGDNPEVRGYARCVRPAPSLDDDVDPALRALVASCLAIDPAARPDGRGLAKALARLAAPPADRRASDPAREAAEELRARLEVLATTPRLPDDILDAYLAARRLSSSHTRPPIDAVHALDTCVARAPGHPLLIAARAYASVRAWRFADFGANGTQAEARAAVALACTVAPTFADTHLAEATLAGDEARLGDVMPALARALAAAPTHATAHEALGRMECESGRAADGRIRLRLVARLDPNDTTIAVPVARTQALRGRLDLFDDEIAPLIGNGAEPSYETLMLLVRVADWFQLPARAAAILPRVPIGRRAGYVLVELCARLVSGDDRVLPNLDALEKVFEGFDAGDRARCNVLQIAAEMFARRDPARACRYLRMLAGASFIDVEWLQLCPSLQGLRHEDAYRECATAVAANVARLWRPARSLPARS